MATLELSLLGGCEGKLASGAPLVLPTRKAWALLCYLALHPGREVGRERLATLLWGERFDEQARASLRQTLYQLRGGLGAHADLLIASRDAVALCGDGIEVDALRIEELARRGSAEDLAAFASFEPGSLLDGLDPVAPDFDAWLMAERARLQELVSEAMERLAALHLERGQAAAAVQTAQRLVHVDPLRERAHRLLMQGLAADGRRSEALKHYQDLERQLMAELGVAPDPETVRLRDQLLRDATGAAPTAQPVAPREATSRPVAGTATAAPGAHWTGRRWGALAAGTLVAVALGLTALGAVHLRQDLPAQEDVPAAAVDWLGAPAIAVLPFENLSGDPTQEHLAAGLTEDLITALSKAPQLLVIARTSVAQYKDNPAKVQDIAEDLGVGYVLEGSVQKSGDDLRLTAQLIDGTSGLHLWSERYDRKLDQIFALQDDIVRQILIELQVELSEGDHVRVASRGTTSLDAWLLRLQAMEELYKFTRESTLRTRELLEAAHRADPAWSRPLGGLAWAHWWEARMGWADDREQAIRAGIELAERAIAMQPDDTLGYMQLGNLVQLQGDHDRAIALREKSVEIAPNDFQANWGLGTVLYRAGQADRAIAVLQHAMKLAPRHPPSLTWGLGYAQLVAGKYEEALATAEQARVRAPDRDVTYVQLAAAYSGLGRSEEAAGAAARLLEVDPAFRVSVWKAGQSDFKDPKVIDEIADLLIEAGLPA